MLGILVIALGLVLALTVLYYLIRYAVRDGVYDAHRLLERDGVRSTLGVGDERSPNSRD